MAENKVCLGVNESGHSGDGAVGVGDNCYGMRRLVKIFDRESDPGPAFISQVSLEDALRNVEALEELSIQGIIVLSLLYFKQ